SSSVDKQLEDEKKLTQTLLDLSFESTFITKNGKCIYINKNVKETFGYSEKLIGKTPFDFFHPDSVELLQGKFSQEKASVYEGKVFDSKGNIHTVAIESQYLDYSESRIRITKMQDITNQKETEKIIKESERNYKEALKNAGNPIGFINQENKFTFVNKAFEDFTEFTANELIGKSYFDLADKEDSKSKEKIKLAKSGRTVSKHRKKCISRQGEIKDVEVSYGFISSSNEVIITLIDLTKEENRKRDLEKQINNEIIKNREKDHLLIQQSRNASMGEMISNIAHQWRQPLNALSLQMNLIDTGLQMENLTNEKIQKISNKSHTLIKSMSQTIDDFRNFFKPNKKKKPFYITNAINDTLALVEHGLINSNIKVNFQKGNIPTYGYENELCQVILNLINNSKDALNENRKENKKINISLTQEETKAVITISDNGGGIPKDILKQIFDPYFSTKEEGKGTGIGLYMSKMIIEENMEGEIIAHNSEDGAVFTIKI
ncbi:MAG: PAS domain-containing sensor histidine kinase, partial [Campylobacterales bacterium]|nr:PAS domain-containing sensor histidine kinase [Campylobacterales bacterium]